MFRLRKAAARPLAARNRASTPAAAAGPDTHARSDHATLVQLLRWRAQAHPERQAFLYLDGQGLERQSLRYGDLHEKAQGLARGLGARGMEGQRILLLFTPGLDFIAAFFGCLAAGSVPVPVNPPRSNRHLGRLRAIAEDAQVALALADPETATRIQRSSTLATQPFEVLCSQDLEAAEHERGAAIEPSAADLAFLQYTSGSTAAPKGVMVSHGNLMHNLEAIRRNHQHHEDAVLVSWLPLFHDMGLIGQVLQSIYAGARCVCLAPAAFVRRPRLWLETVSRYRAHSSGGPNFAYELCLERIPEQERAGLDLSSWRVAFNGAEPIRARTLQRFARAFAPQGFRAEAMAPCYGLAEATLMVSAKAPGVLATAETFATQALEDGKARAAATHTGQGNCARLRPLVASGQVRGKQELRIVDPDSGNPMPPKQIGEIWLRGDSVAQGYWNRPQATLETFEARLSCGEGPFLRTGDLGFLDQDQLYITGRCKDLIILRGRNLYPQDVELSAERSHPALKSGGGAAFAIDEQGEEQLVLVHELARRSQLDAREVFTSMLQALAEEHEVRPAAMVLIRSGLLPRTSSGKVQRRLCRSAFLDGTLKALERWHEETQATRPEPRATVVAAPTAAAAQRPTPDSRARLDRALGWLRDWSQRRLNFRLMDERRCISPHVLIELGNRGFMGLEAPLAAGGMELGLVHTLRCFQQLAAVDLTLGTLVSAHNGLGLRPLMRFATAELQQRYLAPMASGRQLGSLALSEEGAGSNPRALSTVALDDGGGNFRLNGRKIWSGNSAWAGLIHVFARHGGPEGKLSAFVLPQDSPGLHLGAESLTLGLRGMVQGSVQLSDVPAKEEQLLGEAERGLRVAEDIFRFARLGLGALALGGMQRAAQLMLRYAVRRSISTGPLIEHPLTRWRLGEIAAASTALEALVYSLARRAEANAERSDAISLDGAAAAKVAGSELLWQAADSAVQLLGGRGYMESNPAAQLLRDARVFRIFEGPTETLSSYLGSRVLNGGHFDRMLTFELGAPEVAGRLRRTAERLQGTLGSATGSTRDRQALAQHELGMAAVWAALLAAVQGAGEVLDGRATERHLAHAWAERNFTAALERAERWLQVTHTSQSLMGSDQLVDCIRGYESWIGDLAQQHPGEDTTLDDLLRPLPDMAPTQDVENPTSAATEGPSRREFKEPAVAEAEAAPGREAIASASAPLAANTHDASSVDSSPSAREIECWIADWLQQRQGVSGPVDGEQPFAAYGLDSVTAVIMASDLESWLGQSLDADLAWSHPTPRGLAQYLAAAHRPR